MENKMNTEKKNGLFTAKRFKIGAAVVIVCAVVAGIGAWYHHQQKIERRAQIRQAQTRMVEYQAEQRNMALIGEEKVRSLTAQAIGQDESALTFREITLENKWNDDSYREARKQRLNHGDRRDNIPVNGRQPGPATQGNGGVPGGPAQGTVPAPATTAGYDGWQERFFPVYEVTCTSGSLEYELEIDALTGNVLESEVESRFWD